jgi:hypothetical protein
VTQISVDENPLLCYGRGDEKTENQFFGITGTLDIAGHLRRQRIEQATRVLSGLSQARPIFKTLLSQAELFYQQTVLVE